MGNFSIKAIYDNGKPAEGIKAFTHFDKLFFNSSD